MRLEASDPTFIDALIPPNAGRNDRLDRIDRRINWPKVAAILDDVHAAPKGRGANAPRPSIHPRRIVISAKAGTY